MLGVRVEISAKCSCYVWLLLFLCCIWMLGDGVEVIWIWRSLELADVALGEL